MSFSLSDDNLSDDDEDNGGYGMSNNLALSPYRYTLAKKYTSKDKNNTINDEINAINMQEERIIGTPLSKTSKNLPLNKIRINNTKVNIKADHSIFEWMDCKAMFNSIVSWEHKHT